MVRVKRYQARCGPNYRRRSMHHHPLTAVPRDEEPQRKNERRRHPKYHDIHENQLFGSSNEWVTGRHGGSGGGYNSVEKY